MVSKERARLYSNNNYIPHESKLEKKVDLQLDTIHFNMHTFRYF